MRDQYQSKAHEKAVARIQTLKDKLYAITCELEDMEPDLFPADENVALGKAVSALNACDGILCDTFS